MLEIPNREIDVARATLLPLDCLRKQLRQLLGLFNNPGGEFGERLDKYGVEALKPTGGIETPPYVEEFHEIATFAAVTALRVELADPLRGTDGYEQYPEHSSERRMMTQPLWTHPGLSQLGENIRDQYVYDVLYAFQNSIPDSLQCEIVAVLLVPDPPRGSSSPTVPTRTYHSETESMESLQSRYIDRVSKRDEGFKIPESQLSPRTFVGPVDNRLFLPSLDVTDLPPLVRRRDSLIIPDEVVLMRLANYAYHAWYRLANLAYTVFPEDAIRRYAEITPEVRKLIRNVLKRTEADAFGTYYGATSDNPLVDSNSSDPFARPDKRLVTAADAIRASSTLEFNDPISLTTLFDAVCQYFPPPNRPSNDVGTKRTLESALKGAIDSRFTSSESGDAYVVPAPQPTPFYPRTRTLPWEQYRHELAMLRQDNVQLPSADRIQVGLPDGGPCQSAEYASAIQDAHRAAASKMNFEFRRVEAVQPLINPSEIDGMSPAEVIFLTRIGLAMERQINSYSLTQSMASFRDLSDGSKLDIDAERLKDLGLLSQLNTSRTYYSVPWEVRKQLGIPNVSHDGWGERSPSENTLHRTGIDLVALLVASRPDVDRVVRYCDVWRLQPTDCWNDVSHLSKKRLDVVGFSQGEPAVVAEVETKSGGTDGTKRTVEKLAAFPGHVDRYFVTPSGKHLPAIVSRLSATEHFDINASRREKDGYRPSEVQAQLAETDNLGEWFDELLTYRNVRRRLPDQPTKSEYIGSIVGTI